MRLELDTQTALAPDDLHLGEVPAEETLRAWVEHALRGRRAEAELTIRVVDEREGAALNETYRHKTGATNVLSFPFVAPPGVELPLLGDLVICAAVVAREARAQGKPLEAHWAHMVIHGVLHLLGHDHVEPAAAAEMETLEIRLLGDLGYDNPYTETDNDE